MHPLDPLWLLLGEGVWTVEVAEFFITRVDFLLASFLFLSGGGTADGREGEFKLMGVRKRRAALAGFVSL
jgi:hypothetical protein